MGPRLHTHTRNHSWNYSNADAFTEEMSANMTFYDSPPSERISLYATMPRGGYRVSKSNSNKRKSYHLEPPTPLFKTADRLSTAFMLDSPVERQEEAKDYGFPSLKRQISRPTLTVLDQGHEHKRLKSADYYWLMNPAASKTASPNSPISPTETLFPRFEHEIKGLQHNSSISFVCTPTTDSLRLARIRRRKAAVTNNDITPSSVDPLPYIQNNCEHAARALASHRKLHNCDCDFAYLDSRARETGSCWKTTDEGGLLGMEFGPKRPCRKHWFTGFFVRQHMKFHDLHCGCGCFGEKISSQKDDDDKRRIYEDGFRAPSLRAKSLKSFKMKSYGSLRLVRAGSLRVSKRER